MSRSWRQNIYGETMSNEQQQPSVEIVFRASSPYELRDLLLETTERLTEAFDQLNAEIHRAEREAAFARYLRTGRFD